MPRRGINVEGINAEVAAGQWEFQVFAKGAKRAGDETWIARYLLERTGEKYGFSINWHPKPSASSTGMVRHAREFFKRGDENGW